MPNATLVETHLDNLFVRGNSDTSGNQIGGLLTVVGDTVQGGYPNARGNTFQNSTNIGAAGTSQEAVRTITGIVSDGATAKTIMNVVIPNGAQSFVVGLLLRVGITTPGHLYDSTRVAQYTLVVTRVPGAAAVATLSAAANAAIATSAGGQTLTFVLAAAAVTGANTATQTLPINITVTGSVTGTADCAIDVNCLNATGVAANLNAAAPTGVVVS